MHPLTILCSAWGFMITAAAVIHVVGFVGFTLHYAAADYYQSYWNSLEGLIQSTIEGGIYRRPIENLMSGLGWFGVAATVEYATRVLAELRRVGRLHTTRRSSAT